MTLCVLLCFNMAPIDMPPITIAWTIKAWKEPSVPTFHLSLVVTISLSTNRGRWETSNS